jgi:hypothetical protein
LIISVLLHLLVFSVWRVGQSQGWWRDMVLPSWMQWMSKALMPPVPKKSALEIPEPTQLSFVEVDPALATPAAPKKPMFQGAQNTVAANKEIKTLSTMPNIDGTQEDFLKTTENAKPKTQPAPVAVPQPQAVQPQAQPDFKPQAVQPQPITAQSAPRKAYTPGDLAMIKPSDKPLEGKADADAKTGDQTQQPQPPPAHQRPRTLAEAQARNGIVGPKTHHAGGSSNVMPDVSLDVQGTPLGDYLGLLVETVRSHWYQLLENQSADTSGRVVVRFRLHPDGRVSDMKLVQSEVSDLMQMTCQRAILDPKFPKWTREMRLELPNDFYDITFTFYYEP